MNDDVAAQQPSPKKHPRMLVWLGVVLGLAVVITAGIAVFLYIVWQTSPDKALTDALRYARANPGSYHVTGGGNDITVVSNGTSQQISGTYDSLSFDAILHGSTVYVKSSTPHELVKLFGPKALPAQFQPMVDAAADSIKNKWISFSAKSFPAGQSTDSRMAACGVNSGAQVTKDKKASDELSQTYKKHRFIMTKARLQSGSAVHYTATVDQSRYGDFMNALMQTDMHASLSTQCAGMLKNMQKIDFSGVSVDVTLDRSTHALQNLYVNRPNKKPIKVTANYDEVPAISVPTNDTPYESLVNSITQTLFKSYLGS